MTTKKIEPFDADTITLQVENEERLLKQVQFSVRLLLNAIDSGARIAAKHHADWHDDPDGDPEGHRRFHATHEEQFPDAVRQLAAMNMFHHELGEVMLQRRLKRAQESQD